MNQVKVQRDELLGRVKDNREGHRAMFLEAQTRYRELVIQELDRWLQDAREGKRIRRALSMPEPEDHTRDYDTVIAMLEMSVESEIVLPARDFARYVLDQWEWAGKFANDTVSYLGAAQTRTYAASRGVEDQLNY